MRASGLIRRGFDCGDLRTLLRTVRCCAREGQPISRAGRHAAAHGLDEFRKCSLGTRTRVEPVRGAQEVLEARRQRRQIDPKRNDRTLLGARALYFADDMRRGDGVFRQHEHQDAAGVDRLHNRIGVEVSGRHVARRNPAGDARALQGRAQRVSHCRVLRGITDKDGVAGIHGGARSWRLIARSGMAV